MSRDPVGVILLVSWQHEWKTARELAVSYENDIIIITIIIIVITSVYNLLDLLT